MYTLNPDPIWDQKLNNMENCRISGVFVLPFAKNVNFVIFATYLHFKRKNYFTALKFSLYKVFFFRKINVFFIFKNHALPQYIKFVCLNSRFLKMLSVLDEQIKVDRVSL